MRRQADDFQKFLDWARFYGLPMPATGDDVAEFLLELLADGVPFPDIEQIAASVAAGYEHHKVFLDSRPIKAALALAEAQLSPDRILN
jgi:hypothetical protein